MFTFAGVAFHKRITEIEVIYLSIIRSSCLRGMNFCHQSAVYLSPDTKMFFSPVNPKTDFQEPNCNFISNRVINPNPKSIPNPKTNPNLIPNPKFT